MATQHQEQLRWHNRQDASLFLSPSPHPSLSVMLVLTRHIVSPSVAALETPLLFSSLLFFLSSPLSPYDENDDGAVPQAWTD